MDAVALVLIGALILLAVALEPRLERLTRRSAWGEFLDVDAEGRTLFIPFGSAAYIVRDPAVIHRVERLSARFFSLMIVGGLVFAGVLCIVVGLEEHWSFAVVGGAAILAWVALMAWVIHEARAIADDLPRAW